MMDSVPPQSSSDWTHPAKGRDPGPSRNAGARHAEPPPADEDPPGAREPISTRLRIESLPDVPVVRAVTLKRGLSAGLGRARAGQAAFVASELATNIVRQGQGGEIVLDVDLDSSTFWIVAVGPSPSGPGAEAVWCWADETP